MLFTLSYFIIMNKYLWNHLVCFAVDDVVLEHSKLLIESLWTPEINVKIVGDICHNDRLPSTPLLLEKLHVVLVLILLQDQESAVAEPEMGWGVFQHHSCHHSTWWWLCRPRLWVPR